MTMRIFFIILSLTFFSNTVLSDILPYKDSNLSDEERANDLLSRMTLVEKVGQMCQYVGIEHVKKSEKYLSIEEMQAGDAHGFYPNLHSSKMPEMIRRGEIGSFLHVVDPEEANQLQEYARESRLGIPLIIGIDAIHGNGLVRGSTIYPAPLSMASTWNTDLVRQAAQETALEMRVNGSHWAFSPNIDIARDARWGRVGETFGEDPYLVSEMGVAIINGLQQGDFKGDNKVLANAKHFVAGSDPVNGLNLSPMDVSMRSLRQDYFPPFKRAVDEGVFTFMAAHNEINGVPAHSNKFLFTDILRNEWGFEGFVVSDWLDIERLKTMHRVAPTQKEAVFQSVDAGLDMHMHGPRFLEPLIELVNEGRITENRIDEAVYPILLAKFRLGLFEKAQVDLSLASEIMFNKSHQKTALELARQGIVLLKNDDNILPLKSDQKIFITGPNANNHTIMGDWVFEQPEENITTVVEGLEKIIDPSLINYFDIGDQVKEISRKDIILAGKKAKNADVAIVVVGENPLRYDRKGKTSGENVARSSINLFGEQLALVQSIKESGTPTIVIYINGRPLSEPWINDNVDALIEGWEPGALGGLALAEIIFGKVNPSGKLPITIPNSVGHIQTIYNHKPSAYVRKYVDSDSTRPWFVFGDGLSYTKFNYGPIKLSKSKIEKNETFTASIKVKNVGARSGDEIVQLYIRDKFSLVTRPMKELKSFKRISLEAGESTIVKFEVTPDMLSYYDLDMNWIAEPGDYVIMLGSSSRNNELKKKPIKLLN
jgi:beta-glucosidase